MTGLLTTANFIFLNTLFTHLLCYLDIANLTTIDTWLITFKIVVNGIFDLVGRCIKIGQLINHLLSFINQDFVSH